MQRKNFDFRQINITSKVKCDINTSGHFDLLIHEKADFSRTHKFIC